MIFIKISLASLRANFRARNSDMSGFTQSLCVLCSLVFLLRRRREKVEWGWLVSWGEEISKNADELIYKNMCVLLDVCECVTNLSC